MYTQATVANNAASVRATLLGMTSSTKICSPRSVAATGRPEESSLMMPHPTANWPAIEIASASWSSGTITVASTSPPDPQGRTVSCSGTIPWTATNPPAPPPQALSGTYCGITAAGGGVCVDVPADGRQVRNLRAELKLTCGILAKIPVSVPVAYDVAASFGLDLSYSQAFDGTFEGKPIHVTSSGTFDEGGAVVGSVGIAKTDEAIVVIQVDARVEATREAFEAQKATQRERTVQAFREQKVRVFVENLRRALAGEPLEDVVDPSEGY